MTAEILEADARTRRRALIVARVGVMALAVGCFRLSFDALRFAAADYGAVYPALAWIYALLPDTAIVICAALGYLASLDGDGRSPTVILATVIEVVACALSAWANVVAADNNLPGMVMAAVPSPMLFAAIELMKADLRRTRRHRLAAPPVAAPVTPMAEGMAADVEADTEADVATAIPPDITSGRGHLHSVPTGHDDRGRADVAAGTPPVTGRPRSRSRGRGQAAERDGRVAELVAGHVAGGGKVTDPELTVAVATAIGLSDRTARRRLAPFRAGQVAPLTVAADSVGGAA